MLFGLLRNIKSSQISYRPLRREFVVLACLVKEGFILKISFQFFKNIVLSFKLRSGCSIIQRVTFFKTFGTFIFISFCDLKCLIYFFPESVFLLSTEKGILSHSKALFFKIGGKLLVRIN
jgi:ribosomal protein S8